MAEKSELRYIIDTGELNGKPERYLARTAKDLVSSVRNRIFIPKTWVKIKAGDLASPDHPTNRIYLDGSCQGPSTKHAARNIYSFDHHGDCERYLTDATCEQVLKFCKEPNLLSNSFDVIGDHNDLDMVLSAWEVVNIDRLAYDRNFYDLVDLHVKVEANIDTFGDKKPYSTGLNRSIVTMVRANLNRVQAAMDPFREIQSEDHLDATLAGFNMLDQCLLDVNADKPVEYLGKKTIGIPGGRNIVLATSQKDGIYAVEGDISREDKDCCLVIWHDGDRKFTLLLTEMATGFDLNPIYDKLNEAETRAKKKIGITDKGVLNTMWGGESHMGGSPRYYKMSPFIGIEEIKRIVVEEMSRQSEKLLSIQTQLKNGNGNGNGNGHAPKTPTDNK